MAKGTTLQNLLIKLGLNKEPYSAFMMKKPHEMFNPETDTYTSRKGNSCKEVEATLIPFSPHPYQR